jgi:hypothetical protein
MIYLTGDLHGDITRLTPTYFPESDMLTENDYLLQLGDFGCFWYNPPKQEEIENLEFFSQQKYITCFIDGNHENFPMINSYPIVDFCGGKAHKINDKLYHLMRGNVYILNDEKFFVFGGGLSVDKKYRIPRISWWEEEYPTMVEEEHALMTLEQHNFKVDYVLTHVAPSSIVDYMLTHYIFETSRGCESKTKDYVSKFLEMIYNKLEFKHWYFGHYHTNFIINDKFSVLYHKKIKLGYDGRL